MYLPKHIAPVHKATTGRTSVIQRRAAIPQEVQTAADPAAGQANDLTADPNTLPQPEENDDNEDEASGSDGDDDDEGNDTEELITGIAGEVGRLIFGDDAGEDIQTGISALLRILGWFLKLSLFYFLGLSSVV